jgi:DNA-binding beta-propeller fold protein YncE
MTGREVRGGDRAGARLHPGWPVLLLAVLVPAASLAACGVPGAVPSPGAARYVAYVASESTDEVARVVFAAGRLVVERQRSVGVIPTEIDGPHGLAVAPDGRHLYVTLGHGRPFGQLLKLDTRDESMVGQVQLGLFPATVDVTPDGQYAFVANFNLHGDHVPSSVSKVHLPSMTEVVRTETCVMPHGSRISPDGRRHYSACMMDQVLVEIDVATGLVTRRFSVAPGREGLVPLVPGAHARPHRPAAGEPVCSPTWAQPGPDGARVYVACNRSAEVLEIDVAEWRVLRRFVTGTSPYNLEVTPDGALLLVTLRSREEAAVEVVDLASGETRGRVATSTVLPHGLAVTPDSRYAFVSVEGVGSEPGRVDLLDLRALRRVASVEVGQQAGGIAVVR